MHCVNLGKLLHAFVAQFSHLWNGNNLSNLFSRVIAITSPSLLLSFLFFFSTWGQTVFLVVQIPHVHITLCRPKPLSNILSHFFFLKKVIISIPIFQRASLVAQMVKICLQCRRCRFDPWFGKIPWRRERLPTPVFLPGEFHGQRNLVSYSPWDRKELDMTEWLSSVFQMTNLSFKIWPGP